MGGTIDYISRDGSRLTPWMYFVIERANAEFKARFGCELLVTSGIRTNAEQTAIFLSKYRVQWTGNGPYGDVRWWKGKRYVRHVSGGTVAAPGKSNHEIQGTRAAVDLRDSGRDAGVSRGNNPRADWLKANARRLGLEPEGYGFGEPWHYAIPDIFRAVPRPAASTTTGQAGGIEDLLEETEMATIIAQRSNSQLAKGLYNPATGRIREITRHENTLLREAQESHPEQVIYSTVPDATYNALLKGLK